MPDDAIPIEQPKKDDQATRSLRERCRNLLSGIQNRFHFFVSLPVITVIGSLLASHFQYLSAYQDKVAAEAKQQVSAAETTYTDVSIMFSKAITLQQYLFFDFRDSVKANTFSDGHALNTTDARAVFKQYDELRISLRQNIDLLARRVERDLDWRSDPERDPANVSLVDDPVTRIKLGAYNFECESEDGPMPDFHPGESNVALPPPPEMLAYNPKAKPLRLDWYSAKHHVLTLYYCFEVAHRRIVAARQWAANGTVDSAAANAFAHSMDNIQVSFNREAERLNAFMTLAARRIEIIQVKFRPRPWVCHAPLIRELVDVYSKTNYCLPIRTK
jgi:hypothetical protein